MAENKEDFLNRYKTYINELAKSNSEQLFTNGGIEYASVLMAVLFENTKKDARIFCQGFKPTLITKDPYWKALKDYLNKDGNTLKVLVETDEFSKEQPLQLLKEEKYKRGDNSIQVRVASKETIESIYAKLSGNPCNFAVFDHDKFRFESEPDGYKAFGSFNRKNYASALISIFDDAFNKSKELIFPN